MALAQIMERYSPNTSPVTKVKLGSFDVKYFHTSARVKGFVWLLVGPICSVIIGYAVFMFMAFILGAGIVVDETATNFEKSITPASIPVGLIIIIGGSIFSLYRAIHFFRVEGPPSTQ